jgi:hypothetical protein
MRYLLLWLFLTAGVGLAQQDLRRLHARIEAVCPIEGTSVGNINDKATWRIDFKPEATEQQRSNAQSIITTWTNEDFLGPRSERRAERYKIEADPILLAILGYRIELEDETDPVKQDKLKAKIAKAKQDYLAKKAKVREDLPDL